MDDYFTPEKIEELVTVCGWEMVRSHAGKYKLRQKDNHNFETVDFDATVETAEKFCTHVENAA